MCEIIEVSKEYYNKYHKIPFEGEPYYYNNKIYIEGLYFGDLIYKILFNDFHSELKDEIMEIFNITNE